MEDVYVKHGNLCVKNVVSKRCVFSMNLTSVDHIAINVADLQQSIQWYTGSFDCEVLYEDQTQAIIQFANVKLSLILPSREPGHIALEREDANTFGELRKRREGIESTFISDPTGNRVEIVQK